MSKWTTDNIPDLTGKVVIVTGANVGLGFESAKEFGRKGAKTIMACRNPEKGKKALEEIKKEIPYAKIELMQLDLADLKSVHRFVKDFHEKYNRLDVLLNNAGVMFCPYGKTEDGFEMQFGTNHLGHFALTGLLMDSITKTPGSRVVNVSSSGHKMGVMDWNDLMYEKGDYKRMGAYGRSKLANLLFTYELQRRFKKAGVNAISVAAHPGGSRTDLPRHLNRVLYGLAWVFITPLTQSAARGALPQLRASVDPKVKGAEYYGPGGFREMKGNPVIVKSNDKSHNLADAKKLWDVSEQLTGITFNIGGD